MLAWTEIGSSRKRGNDEAILLYQVKSVIIWSCFDEVVPLLFGLEGEVITWSGLLQVLGLCINKVCGLLIYHLWRYLQFYPSKSEDMRLNSFQVSSIAYTDLFML